MVAYPTALGRLCTHTPEDEDGSALKCPRTTSVSPVAEVYTLRDSPYEYGDHQLRRRRHGAAHLPHEERRQLATVLSSPLLRPPFSPLPTTFIWCPKFTTSAPGAGSTSTQPPTPPCKPASAVARVKPWKFLAVTQNSDELISY
ncbi:hypothetical protein GUJ93_ZPchr0006g40804 [Zizania palustris]|uniref:Uncharacterized protein n=1 Tax=Zizania palustris TaxID=103762 RepID=A0A8J5T366_ZIZPA|nr:hypothetical protein GUJ93_ZPchr0006g40804 [Zizania palustris]